MLVYGPILGESFPKLSRKKWLLGGISRNTPSLKLNLWVFRGCFETNCGVDQKDKGRLIDWYVQANSSAYEHLQTFAMQSLRYLQHFLADMNPFNQWQRFIYCFITFSSDIKQLEVSGEEQSSRFFVMTLVFSQFFFFFQEAPRRIGKPMTYGLLKSLSKGL